MTVYLVHAQVKSKYIKMVGRDPDTGQIIKHIELDDQ